MKLLLKMKMSPLDPSDFSNFMLVLNIGFLCRILRYVERFLNETETGEIGFGIDLCQSDFRIGFITATALANLVNNLKRR